jgi:putative membrane protein
VFSAIVSALHVLALGIGLPAIFLRGRALNGSLDREGIRRVLLADTAWGIAAALWLVTGLLRAFGGLEKGTAFYLGSWLFLLKMALFVTIVLLELRPMLTLGRWRSTLRAGRTPDTSPARTLFQLSHAELGLVVVMVFVASFMARGFGLR